MSVPGNNWEWFSLIEPEIDVEPDEATVDDLTEVAKKHARQVLDRVDDLDVEMDDLEWSVSERMKGKHGVCESLDGGRIEIRLSLPSLRYNGWVTVMKVTRHELVHAWQHKHDKLDFNPGVDYAHDDESFERWMDVLSIDKTGPKVTEYKYSLRCTLCGSTWGYHRMCKSIRGILRGDRYCATCGPKSKGEVDVFRDGEELTEEMISEPDEDDEELDEYQVRVFLHNNADASYVSMDSDDYEWFPKTVEITEFYGIGDSVAEEIGDEIVKIDDMLGDEGGLSDVVVDAVQDQFVGRLEEDVQEKFDEALEERDEDDLELLERVIRGEGAWWENREVIGGVGEIEMMCNFLIEDVSEGDVLRIETEGGDTYSGEVSLDYLTIGERTVWIPEVGDHHIRIGVKSESFDVDCVSIRASKRGVWIRPQLVFENATLEGDRLHRHAPEKRHRIEGIRVIG